MADEWESQDLRERIDHLEGEMVRRDEWLFHSIWALIRSMNGAIRAGVIICAFLIKGWGEWWQIAAGIIVWAAWWWFDTARLERLEAEDKVKIGRR